MPKIAEPRFVMPRAALETYRFAGNDKARINLKYIHFEAEKTPGKGKVTTFHAVTTDGHRMMHVWWYGTGKDKLPAPINVEAEAAEFLLKSVKKEKVTDPPIKFTLSVDDGDIMLMSDTEVGTKDGVYSECLDVGYPDWRQVIPTPQSGKMEVSHEIGMDLSYLRDLDKFQWACGYDNPGVVLHYHDKEALAPTLWKPMGMAKDQDTEFEYILMPMRH